MRIDVNTRRPVLKMNTGGLSGPAVGRALNRLLDQVAAGDLPNDRSVLLPLLARTSEKNNGNPVVVPLPVRSFRRPSQRRKASSTAGLKMEKSSP